MTSCLRKMFLFIKYFQESFQFSHQLPSCYINKFRHACQKKLSISITFLIKLSINHCLAVKKLRTYFLVYHNQLVLPSNMGEMNQ